MLQQQESVLTAMTSLLKGMTDLDFLKFHDAFELEEEKEQIEP